MGSDCIWQTATEKLGVKSPLSPLDPIPLCCRLDEGVLVAALHLLAPQTQRINKEWRGVSVIPTVEGGDVLAVGGGMTLTGNLDRALRCLVIRLPGRLEGRGVGQCWR